MKTITHKPIVAVLSTIVFSMGMIAPLQCLASIITDPFTNSASWGAPFTESGKNMAVTNGRMNFTSFTIAAGGAGLARTTPFLTRTQSWSVKVDVHIDPFTILNENHGVSVFLGVGKTSDYLGTHVILGFDRDWWDPSFYGINDDVQVNGVDVPGFTNLNLLASSDATLRLDYNAGAQTISYYCDVDGPSGGSGWMLLGTTNIASGTYNLQLSQSDTLSVLLAGWSDEQVVTNGQAYLDNLEITISDPASEYTYTTNNGAITITGYTGAGGAIDIPDSINGLPVTSVGDSAFYGNASLTSVTIPPGILTIGYSAFRDCTALGMISIPYTVTNIGGWAFNYCLNLTTITVDTNNPAYSSMTGMLFNKIQSSLILYSPALLAESYTIPSSVVSVGEAAFAYCFRLKIVNIPATVHTVERNAFSSCVGLTNLLIANSVTNIGFGAFFSCTGLTNITIPNSVTSIGNAPFANCTKLTSLNVDVLNPAYISVNGALLNKMQTKLLQFPGGKVGSYIVSITVTNVGDFAFAGCGGLTGIYFKGNPPSLGVGVFNGADNSTVYYLPGTVGWGATYGGRPAVLWNPTPQTDGPSFGIKTNRFGFNITGTTNIPIVVEAGTNVSGGTWTPLSNGKLTNGLIYFSDSQWTNSPKRFYRIRSP